MRHNDVQHPEFIIDGMTPDGKIQKVPHLYQREGESWDQFMARIQRVSNSLNNDAPDGPEHISIPTIIMIAIAGLVMWWAILMLIRNLVQ